MPTSGFNIFDIYINIDSKRAKTVNKLLIYLAKACVGKNVKVRRPDISSETNSNENKVRTH